MILAIDTSAVLAHVLDEPEAARIRRTLAESTGPVLISAATVVEIQTVLFRRFDIDRIADLDDLIAFVPMEVVPVTFAQVKIARSGYARFGRASGGGRRGLNLGDCFSYALAIEREAALLFVGDDFAGTDVRRCL